MEKPKHLAVFLYDFQGGGAQRRTLVLAQGFAARGHRVDLVVVRSAGPLRRLIPPGVCLVELGPVRPGGWGRLPVALVRRARRLRVAESVAALAAYLRREQPDVVLSAANHVHLAAVWARRRSGSRVPLVLRISNQLSHRDEGSGGSRRPLASLLARRYYPDAEGFIAVSDGVAEDFARTTGLPRERIAKIYNPVVTSDLDDLSRARVDHPWFTPAGAPVILGAGRMSRQKDFETLLRGFAQLRTETRVRLVILGRCGRHQRQRFMRLADALGVADDVSLPGFVDNPYAYMSRAALFVLSSAWEGLPGVLIEAMACGCPVVSTDCPSGPAEILVGGRYGPLVPVGDAAMLAAAMRGVLDAPLDRDALRARAAEFSVAKATDAYLEALLAVSTGSTSPRRRSLPADARRNAA